MKFWNFSILFLLLLTACKKKYYYIIDKEPEKSERFDSDSIAYVKVFVVYTSLKKFYSDAINSGDKNAVQYIPRYFQIFDENHVDITKNINFNNKQEIERLLTERINSKPNKFKKEKNNITLSK